MGFRFRKSINLGCFKVNLSKHGVGYSFGVPGFRKTFKSTGGTRTTCSIPGTGLSYSTDSKKLKLKDSKKSSGKTVRASSTATVEYVDPFKVESVMQDSNKNEFVNNLNKITSFNRRRIPWLCVSAYFIFILTGVYFVGFNELLSEAATGDTLGGLVFNTIMILPFIFIFKYYFRKKTIDLDINMDTDVTASYAGIDQVSDLLKSISAITEMTSYDNTKKQVRTDVDELKFGKEKILGLKSNCEFCYIHSNTIKVYFLPNIVLAYQNRKWIGIEYSDLTISYQPASLFRPKQEATDSKLIREGWAYENKDGSRDKRYSTNIPGYWYEYGLVKLTSNNGLKLFMLISNTTKASQFNTILEEYKNIITNK